MSIFLQNPPGCQKGTKEGGRDSAWKHKENAASHETPFSPCHAKQWAQRSPMFIAEHNSAVITVVFHPSTNFLQERLSNDLVGAYATMGADIGKA